MAKYWSFTFSIIPSKEPGLISFRMDWLDLLAVQGTLKMEVVKQEMARVNVNILGISELRWTGMDEFNSDGHYINHCGQESLRINGVALIPNKRV